jgi:ABC-2 type transport system permease protein
MYRLQSEIGEDNVNRALRKLIADHAFKGAPYPTTLDFLPPCAPRRRPTSRP